jgi:hypothetical protein
MQEQLVSLHLEDGDLLKTNGRREVRDFSEMPSVKLITASIIYRGFPSLTSGQEYGHQAG